MKKLLLLTGIILLIAGVLSLSFGALNLFAGKHTLDGSAELYGRMHQRMIVFLALGIVLTAIGGLCVVLYFKV